MQTSGTTAVFQVQIISVRGATAQSDIAIDDLQIYDGQCRQGACSFENGLCSWHQAYDDDTNWSLGVVRCHGYNFIGLKIFFFQVKSSFS